MSALPRPIPEPDGLAAEFYARCAEGRLCFRRCTDCRAWRHLPRHLCPRCGSARWTWEPSTGRGQVYTSTVTHQAMHPAFTAETPYAVVVVEMDEGVRLVSRIRGIALDRLEIGMPVQVELEHVAAGLALPYFRESQ